MKLIDSSAWLAYFLDHPTAARIAPHILEIERVLVPSLVIYEVMRQMLKRKDRAATELVTAQLCRGVVVPTDAQLAMLAAPLSLRHGLGTVDALIYATALQHRATLVTLDNDFRGLPRVKVL